MPPLETPCPVDVLQTRTGTMSVDHAILLNESSPGVSLITTESDFHALHNQIAFANLAFANPLPTPATVDFKKQSVVVVRNTRYLNRFGSIRAESDGQTLWVSAQQTRTARPVTNVVYVAVFVVPLNNIKTVVLR